MLQSRVLFRAAAATAANARSSQTLSSAACGSRGAGGSNGSSSTSPPPASAPRDSVTVTLHRLDKESPHEQREALRVLIRCHEAAVQRNATRKDTRSSTYDQDACALFPYYQLASLPPTTGGVHRAAVRTALAAEGGPLTELQDGLLRPWRTAGERAVVVFGAKSIPYLKRQLSCDDTHTFLVVDHSLKALANAAAALVKDFGPRVHFLRADAMFTVLSVLPRDAVDTVVAPMPAPFWSEKGSYRRLVTSDFICATHRVLRERAGPQDPRGLVAFTDCEPYADFMVEQLTEAKLIVPWTRKNPHEAYSRWLPVTSAAASDPGSGPADTAAAGPREFAQQRFGTVVAVAASKSGPTTEAALAFIEGFDYKRRHYRAFNDGSG